MKQKNCELCDKNKAMVYCESDQASLCWDCDSKVHSANFLVAKHSRNLLCHSCQNSTPWTASGPKLSPTFSVCNSCLENTRLRDPIEENYQTEMDNDEDEDEYGSSESEIDDEDEEDDDGNQVVPLSSSPSSNFSPSSSASYGDLSATGDGGGGG